MLRQRRSGAKSRERVPNKSMRVAVVNRRGGCRPGNGRLPPLIYFAARAGLRRQTSIVALLIIAVFASNALLSRRNCSYLEAELVDSCLSGLFYGRPQDIAMFRGRVRAACVGKTMGCEQTRPRSIHRERTELCESVSYLGHHEHVASLRR